MPSEMDNTEKQYILGTERAELHRLGLQHQVWSAEARERARAVRQRLAQKK